MNINDIHNIAYYNIQIEFYPSDNSKNIKSKRLMILVIFENEYS